MLNNLVQPFVLSIGLPFVNILKDERELIEQCQAGNRHAFEFLYKKYARLLMGICLRYAKDEAQAADILQDAFIKIVRNINGFEFKGSFEGWIKRITVHTAIDQFNQNKKDSLDFEDDVLSFDNLNSTNETEENLSAKELLKLIHTLPKGYAMVFNLYVIEGYKHHEIGTLLGISEGTSKSQLAKAKQALRKLITREEHAAA